MDQRRPTRKSRFPPTTKIRTLVYVNIYNGRTGNVRLKEAIFAMGISINDLGPAVGVHAKIGQRWVYEARVPRRRTAERVAHRLGVPVDWLWPEIDGDDKRVPADLGRVSNVLGECLPTAVTSLTIDARVSVMDNSEVSGRPFNCEERNRRPRGHLAGGEAA